MKGKNRPAFVEKLRRALVRALAGVPSARVVVLHARLLVWVSADDAPLAHRRIARVFGVHSVSDAWVCPRDLDAITPVAIELVREALAAGPWRGSKPSFRVAAQRGDKRFPMTSVELGRELGHRIQEAHGLPVDLFTPAIELGVEIGHEHALVFVGSTPGPGGLPTGAEGKVNLLLSGGIDSPVAGWMAARRGCPLEATFFHSFPWVGDATRAKVVELARHLASWAGPVPLHVVPFGEAQRALRDAGPGELAVVLYRRTMMRVAARIAHRRGALALVTGENLAQVASQTLHNLALIDEVVKGLPILRPVITFEKMEIVALAERVGTFATSILPHEDACQLFVPAHPALRASRNAVLEAEARVDAEAMADDLARRATVTEVVAR